MARHPSQGSRTWSFQRPGDAEKERAVYSGLNYTEMLPARNHDFGIIGDMASPEHN